MKKKLKNERERKWKRNRETKKKQRKEEGSVKNEINKNGDEKLKQKRNMKREKNG